MSFIFTVLTLFFDEYQIPANPFQLIYEIIVCILFGIPNTILSIIAYVYFPPEPKDVGGKVILVSIKDIFNMSQCNLNIFKTIKKKKKLYTIIVNYIPILYRVLTFKLKCETNKIYIFFFLITVYLHCLLNSSIQCACIFL